MKRVGLIGLLALAGCQSSSTDWQAIGSLVGTAVARYECAKLSPDSALDLLCTDAAGVAMTVAEAKVKGILATKRITKG